MTTFYLIRHAASPWTPDEQRPLSVRGLEQAERVAVVMQAQWDGADAIYSSPFRRAYETVAPLAQQIKMNVRLTNELCERCLAGGPVADFMEAVAETWRNPEFAHPHGETNAAAQRRGIGLLARLRARYPDGRLILSTHGNLLALILQHFDSSVDFEFWCRLTMPDIYRLTLKGSDVEIERLWNCR